MESFNCVACPGPAASSVRPADVNKRALGLQTVSYPFCSTPNLGFILALNNCEVGSGAACGPSFLLYMCMWVRTFDRKNSGWVKVGILRLNCYNFVWFLEDGSWEGCSGVLICMQGADGNRILLWRRPAGKSGAETGSRLPEQEDPLDPG